jgi:hypothetical protein
MSCTARRLLSERCVDHKSDVIPSPFQFFSLFLNGAGGKGVEIWKGWYCLHLPFRTLILEGQQKPIMELMKMGEGEFSAHAISESITEFKVPLA